MSKDELKNNNWYLVTLEDKDALPGKSFFKIIQLILKVVNFKFVIIDDIEGAGEDWLVYSLQEKENTIMEIDDFLKVLCGVTQFDWGDFFLFKEYPSSWNNSEEEFYPNVISQTDTTIRAIDDTYIYIYTKYKEIVDLIKNNYVIESVSLDSLDRLEYPG